MIVRERRGLGGRWLLDYIAPQHQSTSAADHGNRPMLINSGLGGTDPLTLTQAKRAVLAVAASRPDLKYRLLHLTINPSPEITQNDRRTACLTTLAACMDAIGAGDRIALAAFHVVEQSGEPREHLHAAIALASPETGQSISQHKLRERLRQVADTATAEFEAPRRETPLPLDLEDIVEPPQRAPTPPAHDLHELFRQHVARLADRQRERVRTRRRAREIEL